MIIFMYYLFFLLKFIVSFIVWYVLILLGYFVFRVLKFLVLFIRDLGGRLGLMIGFLVEINDVYSLGEGCVGRLG